MPTNENTYNSRVTSEALEAKFRQVFPSQGGAELVDDLYASGVIQPVIDFSSVAEGSVLPQYLQTSLDIGVNSTETINTTSTVITNPGFWRIDYQISSRNDNTLDLSADIRLTDGLVTKRLVNFIVWDSSANPNNTTFGFNSIFVFVKAGESVVAQSTSANIAVQTVCRQVATVNGTLVNPLGFTFS